MKRIDRKIGQKILIVLTAGIGDLILASKAIRAIKNKFPDARLYLLTTTQASAIAKNYAYLDRVFAFPIRELRKMTFAHLHDIFKLLIDLRKLETDTMINLYRVTSFFGALKMGFLFFLVNARTKVGQDAKGFGLFLNRKIPIAAFQHRHAVDAMLEIAKAIGGIPDNAGIQVFWDKSSEKKLEHLFKNGISKKIGINPGADQPSKRWNPNHYALIADQLTRQCHAEIFLLGGPGEENISRAIASRMSAKAENLAGKLTLNDLVYLLSRLDLLLTNDSGPMHVGAALQIPLVALFGPESPKYFGPYARTDLYRVLYKENLACRPCKKKKCEQPLCLEQITPHEVLKKCLELIRK